jgi:hypothetical protein
MPIIAEDRIAEDRATVLKSFERFLNENFRSKDSKGSIINSLTIEFSDMLPTGEPCMPEIEQKIDDDVFFIFKSFEGFLNENFRSKDSKGSIINSLTFEFGEMPSAGVSCEQGIEQKIDDGEFRGNFRMPIRAVRIRKVCHDKDCSDYHFETVGSIV